MTKELLLKFLDGIMVLWLCFWLIYRLKYSYIAEMMSEIYFKIIQCEREWREV